MSGPRTQCANGAVKEMLFLHISNREKTKNKEPECVTDLQPSLELLQPVCAGPGMIDEICSTYSSNSCPEGRANPLQL